MIVVDLTLPLGPDTPVVEGDPPVTLARVRSHDPDGYQVTAVCLGSHSGTHLDAPRHFFPEGATLDSYPADRLVRPGWVVDVRPPGGTPAARIEADVLAERLEGCDLQPGDFLLLCTGGALLADDAVPLLLESEAGLVGTDAPSLDDHPYPAHVLLLGAGLLLAENLTNLDKLGSGRVMCAFLPLALPAADGAPVRAVAWR
jgi:kynurenine formamidase